MLMTIKLMLTVINNAPEVNALFSTGRIAFASDSEMGSTCITFKLTFEESEYNMFVQAIVNSSERSMRRALVLLYFICWLNMPGESQ